jgi:hypothetical protein
LAPPILHQRDGARQGATVGQPLLADQRRAHVGDDTHPIVIGKVGRVHELHAIAFAVEGAHVQQWQVGIAAAAGAEDPGADGQRFDVVGGDIAPAHVNILTQTRS